MCEQRHERSVESGSPSVNVTSATAELGEQSQAVLQARIHPTVTCRNHAGLGQGWGQGGVCWPRQLQGAGKLKHPAPCSSRGPHGGESPSGC